MPSSLGKKFWFVVFADFHGVNTLTMSDFKLPMWLLNAELGRVMQNQFFAKLVLANSSTLLKIC